MRGKRLWILVIVLAFVVIAAILAGAGMIYLLQRPTAIQEGTVVELQITGVLSDLPVEDPFAKIFAPDSQNLWDLEQFFRNAARDDKVRAVYLEIFPFSASLAQIEELRDYMRRFRDSGKEIHVFLAADFANESAMYLASAADEITMNPIAGSMINGFMAEVFFMKRTLDKLGIRPNFIQFKEYKSAETYTRQSMTPEIREMLRSILVELEDRFVETVARDRGIDAAVIRRLIENGIDTGDSLLESGLVDHLGYRDDVIDRMTEEGRKYRGISAGRFRSYASSRFADRGRRIAVVGGQGPIIAGKSQPFAEVMGGMTVAGHLREIRENDSYAGVIFRVNSPGGSAVGSDMVWQEVESLREAGKPVVVSMSGVAGSGGYYVSMAANRIVSQPSTITGSVGVIFGKFDLSGFYDWIGMDIDRIKINPNADLLSFHSSLTPQQEEKVRLWMDDLYTKFVDKAADGRDQSFEEFEPKAHGRIYTGQQALEIGLVDSLGGMTQAVSEMKALLDISEEETIRLELYPKPRTLWEILMSGELFEMKQPNPLTVQSLLEQLRELEEAKVWLMMPEFEIR